MAQHAPQTQHVLQGVHEVKRNERAMTRNEWNAYTQWSDARYREQRAIVVTQRAEDAPVIPQFKDTTRDAAHNEGDK
jgi:hypothetical protein